MNKLTFVLTGSACPEQYDVYKDGTNIGYIRVRWGCAVFASDPCYNIIFVSGSIGDSCWAGKFDSDQQRNDFFDLCNNVYSVYEQLGDDFVTYDFDTIKSIEQYEKLLKENYDNKHRVISDEERQKCDKIIEKFKEDYKEIICDAVHNNVKNTMKQLMNSDSLMRKIFIVEEIKDEPTQGIRIS